MSTSVPELNQDSGAVAPVARLRDVHKRFGDVRAVDGLDLEIRAGEVLALLGPNGAGKTTSVRLLLGTLRPDSGEVTVLGGDPAARAQRKRMGAMLQISGLPVKLKVWEHLDLFRSYYPRPLAMDALVEMAGLGEFLDRRYEALSGGQKQRLHFALALVGDPELLFLDEPTTGLDTGSRRGLWNAVRDSAGQGRTVLLTTHYLEEADALADRVAVVDHGRLVALGTPAEIKAAVAGRSIRCVTSVDPNTIRAMEGVRSVETRGAITEILAVEAEPVLRRLFDLDGDLRDLEVSGAGLEQAFMDLTAEPDRRTQEGATP